MSAVRLSTLCVPLSNLVRLGSNARRNRLGTAKKSSSDAAVKTRVERYLVHSRCQQTMTTLLIWNCTRACSSLCPWQRLRHTYLLFAPSATASQVQDSEKKLYMSQAPVLARVLLRHIKRPASGGGQRSKMIIGNATIDNFKQIAGHTETYSRC